MLKHLTIVNKILCCEKNSCMNMGFPGGSDGKESNCNEGDLGSIPGLGRSPGGGNGNPLQYSCLENPMDRRNLAGYSPWGHRQLDTTEPLSKVQQMNIFVIGQVNYWGFLILLLIKGELDNPLSYQKTKGTSLKFLNKFVS